MSATKCFYLALILIGFSSHTFASLEDDFQTAVYLIKQQQYSDAIEVLNDVRKRGMKKPALYHNLAICHYKLDQYEQAEKFFVKLRNFPNERMQAEFNLGLLALKQNQPERARKQFSYVKNNANNKKLVTLARIQLGELKQVPVEKSKQWFAYLSTAFGNDSNVIADPDNGAIINAGSHYFSIYADGELILVGDEDNGVSFFASTSSTDYSDFPVYDYAQTSFGLQGTFQAGSWDNLIRYRSLQSTLGSIDYQKTSHIELSTSAYLSSDFRFRLRYRHYDITSLNPAYSYLSGTRQRIRAEIKYKAQSNYAKLYYELETNDRVNSATSNYSPTRHSFRAFYKHVITEDLSIRGDYSYRFSIYEAGNVSPARDDERSRYGLRLTYRFDKNWKIRAKYEHTSNESTLPASYSYERDVTSLELIASF